MIETEKFVEIIDSYEKAFVQHGNSPAALLGAKGRQALRFQALAPLVAGAGCEQSILDYGCGLAHLLPFLLKLGWRGRYCGVDLVPSFIEDNRRTYAGNVDFKVIEPQETLKGSWDIVFASGVFSLITHESERESKAYAFNRMAELFMLCESCFVCDFMTEYVDFKQAGAQHFAPQEVIEFFVKNLSRRFVLRHDLMPYEFTMISYRHDDIERPANVYATEAVAGC